MNWPKPLATVLFTAVLLFTPVAQVLTLNVPTDYPTIQLALDAAKTPHTNGEPVLIRVAPGLYHENVRWQSVSNAAVTIEATGAVLSGSDAATYTALGSGLYAVSWPYNWALSTIPKGWESVTVPLELRHREALWYKDSANIEHPFLLSLACDNLQLNRFCIDITAKRLVFRLSSEPLSVEVAMRETCAILSGDNLVIRGLTVEHCASDLDKAGTNITGRNITLEDMVFRQNVSGGLNTSNTTNLTTRGMLFADNGLTGYGGAYNVGLRSTDDTAIRNNWRGFAYNFTGWSIAGVKHLRSTDATYTGLTVADNQTHGLWLDYQHVNLNISNLTSRDNLNAGVYLEASAGAFTITNSQITGNAKAAAYASLYAANTTDVTLENVYVQSNRAALFIGGESPCRNVGDICVPVAARWHIHNSQFVSPFASIQVATGFDGWKNTLDSDYNAYVGRIQQFLYPSPYNRQSLAQSQALTGQDAHSTNVLPTTPTPVPTSLPTPIPIGTVTGEPILTPTSDWIILQFEGEIRFRVVEP